MAVKTPGLKVKYSLYSAFAFFILANPVTFIVVEKLLGGFVRIAGPTGCPTAVGLFLHSIVFFGVLYGLMSLPKDLPE
jgi:hypothetical protein